MTRDKLLTRVIGKIVNKDCLLAAKTSLHKTIYFIHTGDISHRCETF